LVLILTVGALVQVIHYADVEAGIGEPLHLVLLVQTLLALALAASTCLGDR
jgi:hypothetical protein